MRSPCVPRRQWMALTGVLMASISAHAGCRLQALTPHGSEAHIGAIHIKLGQADDVIAPQAWQGPLIAGKCTLDIGIIEPPLKLASSNLLYVPTYSGSVRQLMLVDLARCTIRWQSAPFSGSLAINPRQLRLGGTYIALDARCLPINKP